MPVDDVGRHAFQRVRPPARIAVLVDDLRADALDEIVPGNAGERDAIVLLEAFLQAFEGSRIAHIAQRHLERGRRHFLHGGERGLRRIVLRGGEAGDDVFHVVGAEAGVDPGSRRLNLAGCRRARERAEPGADIIGRTARGERLRQFGKLCGGDMDVGELAENCVGRVHALAGQRHIGAGEAWRARQPIGSADIGKEADADFRQGDGRTLGDDPVRRVRREADAAAHDQAIHHRDEGLRITRDQHVEIIFRRPELLRQRTARLCRIIKRADVAARAQPALAGAVEQHGADGRIGRPRAQQRGHGDGHVERERVERLRPVQRDAAQRALLADDQVAVLHAASKLSCKLACKFSCKFSCTITPLIVRRGFALR